MDATTQVEEKVGKLLFEELKKATELQSQLVKPPQRLMSLQPKLLMTLFLTQVLRTTHKLKLPPCVPAEAGGLFPPQYLFRISLCRGPNGTGDAEIVSL